jgi:hypothetical protein
MQILFAVHCMGKLTSAQSSCCTASVGIWKANNRHSADLRTSLQAVTNRPSDYCGMRQTLLVHHTRAEARLKSHVRARQVSLEPGHSKPDHYIKEPAVKAYVRNGKAQRYGSSLQRDRKIDPCQVGQTNKTFASYHRKFKSKSNAESRQGGWIFYFL